MRENERIEPTKGGHTGTKLKSPLDSRGNIYTGEVFAGERVQRFVPVR